LAFTSEATGFVLHAEKRKVMQKSIRRDLVSFFIGLKGLMGLNGIDGIERD